jgi:hypothetical protein
MAKRSFGNYQEFWAFYVTEHRQKLTRQFHFAGMTGAILCVVAAYLFGALWPLALAPVIAYAMSWAGHFWIEENTPATFRNPFRSLIADFHMYALMAAGRMDDEVERYAE